MTSAFWLNAVIVVLTTLASCWLWVVYIRNAKGHPLKAALADCGILALQMVNVVSYVNDHRLAVPVLLAAFVGTYLSVKTVA